VIVLGDLVTVTDGDGLVTQQRVEDLGAFMATAGTIRLGWGRFEDDAERPVRVRHTLAGIHVYMSDVSAVEDVTGQCEASRERVCLSPNVDHGSEPLHVLSEQLCIVS